MDGEIDAKTRATRQEFYGRLAPHNLAPLWEVLGDLVPAEPKSTAVPHHWRYETLRPLLMESGGLLTAEEAERRVLVLENPALPGRSMTTGTLYAGVQLILPGEIAAAHRHTPSALRFVLESDGGFTAVGGERTTMRPGDFIITPAWAWHDHGNDGDGPVSWLDGLDIPIVAFFEAIFREGYNDKRHETTRPEGDSLARFGNAMLPLEADRRYGPTSPIFNYPYERTREALITAGRAGAPDPHTAITLRYANPNDGGWAMPTIAAWMTHVPAGFGTVPLRSTDGMVVAIAEGRGTAKVGDETFRFEARDTVAVPGWTWRSFEATDDCFLFCFSDRVAQEKLGLFREERGRAR